MFQSTPPQGGRPVYSKHSSIMIVSIHAPARRATSGRVLLPCSGCVSIHAPARRATALLALFHLLNYVSIHAPARRATWRPLLSRSYRPRFNPRPRKEGDCYYVNHCIYGVNYRFCAKQKTELFIIRISQNRIP